MVCFKVKKIKSNLESANLWYIVYSIVYYAIVVRVFDVRWRSTLPTWPNTCERSWAVTTLVRGCSPVTSLACHRALSASCCPSPNTGTSWPRRDAIPTAECTSGFVTEATSPPSRLMRPRKVSILYVYRSSALFCGPVGPQRQSSHQAKLGCKC